MRRCPQTIQATIESTRNVRGEFRRTVFARHSEETAESGRGQTGGQTALRI